MSDETTAGGGDVYPVIRVGPERVIVTALRLDGFSYTTIADGHTQVHAATFTPENSVAVAGPVMVVFGADEEGA